MSQDVRVLVTDRRNLPGSLSCPGRHGCEPGGKTRPGDVWSFLDKTRGTNKPCRLCRSAGLPVGDADVARPDSGSLIWALCPRAVL
jgi:hypothetical protein